MYTMPFHADIHSSSNILVEEVVNSLPSHVEQLHALQSIAAATKAQLAAVSKSYLLSLAPESGIELDFAVIRAPGGNGKTESAVIVRTMGIMLSSDEARDELEWAEDESIICAARALGLRAPESRSGIDRWLDTEPAKPLIDFLSAAWGYGWLTFCHCGKLSEGAILVSRTGFKPIVGRDSGA